MLGRRVAVRQSLHTSDDGEGTELQGEAAGVSDMSGVREGIGEGVTGCAQPNPTHSGERGVGSGR